MNILRDFFRSSVGRCAALVAICLVWVELIKVIA